jgi:hypothetical protein
MPSYSLSSPLSTALRSGNDPVNVVACALRAKMPCEEIIEQLLLGGMSEEKVSRVMVVGMRLFLTRSAFWNIIPGLIIVFIGFAPLMVGFSGCGIAASIIFLIGGYFVALGIFQICVATFAVDKRLG